MDRLRPVHLLAGLGWLNVFALLWAVLLGWLKVDSFAIGATFVCFLVFAIAVSALGAGK